MDGKVQVSFITVAAAALTGGHKQTAAAAAEAAAAAATPETNGGIQPGKCGGVVKKRNSEISPPPCRKPSFHSPTR